MRLFIAINLEPATRAELYGATEPLRRILSDARWVAPELLHMTVKFLGSRTAEDARRAAAVLDEVAAQHRAIPYGIGGVGAFPNLRRPNVVWVGVQADHRLELISHDVECACAELGVPLEGRAFRPHVTIGRVRGGDPARLASFASACEKVSYQAQSRVHSLDLMHSHHVNGCLTYSLVHCAKMPWQ